MPGLPALNILQLVRYALYAFDLLLFVRVIASWTRISPYDRTWGPIISLATRITDPLLEPIRRAIDPFQRRSGIDFSPLVLYIILEFLYGTLARMLGSRM